MSERQPAKGTFQVKRAAVPAAFEAAGLGRHSLDKSFSGDLEATSLGEMLSAGGSVPGSAGYVAMERVTGTLQGRAGSFVLQHTATMNRGTPSLTLTVVPDTGTDALTGLSGSMRIIIDKGQHFYEFDYEIAIEGPAAP
jgi:hypothetical protein